MKIDIDKIIKDLEGGDVVNGRKTVQGQPPVWYTIKHAICELIQAEGLPVAPDDRLRLFNLGLRIVNETGETEISDAEADLLLSILKFHPSTLAAGRVTEALNKEK